MTPTPFGNFDWSNILADALAPSQAALEKATQRKKDFIERITKNECTQQEFFEAFTNFDFTEDEIIAVCIALNSNDKITCFTFGAAEPKKHQRHLPVICEQLKTNKTITSLNLSRTIVETDGLKEVARLLRTNQNITSLLLNYTNIQEEQSVALLSHLILSNKTLLNLGIGGNEFSEISLNRLIDAISKNSSLKSLDLRNIKALNSTMIQRITTAKPSIEIYKSEENPFEFRVAELLPGISRPPALFSFLQPAATEPTRPPLLPFLNPFVGPSFQFDFQATQAPTIKNGVETITSVPKFGAEHKLEAEHNLLQPQLNGQAQAKSQPQSQSESDLGPSSEGMALVKIAPERTTREQLEYSKLRDNKTLIEAVLNRQCCDDNFNAAFNKLHFFGDELRNLLQALNSNPDIQTLNLRAMSSKYNLQFHIFCEVLTTNTTIKHLDLSFFDLDHEGLKQVVEMLKTNTTIVSLDLSSNKLNDETSVALLCELILTNKTLRSLNINGIRCNVPEFLKIIDALSKNNTLQSIGVGYCHYAFGPPKPNDTMIKLFEILKHHPSITSIDLSHNEFGIPEITALANLLKENPRIRHLNLSFIGEDALSHIKGLSTEGYQILSQAISTTKTLQHLTINNLRFEANAKELNLLLEALRCNTSIFRLDFSSHFKDQDIDAFLNYLKFQKNIVSITLPAMFSIFDHFDQLDGVLKTNENISELRFGCLLHYQGHERLIKLLKDNPQITSLKLYYDRYNQARSLYQRQIQLQLEENQRMYGNATRQSFLTSLYHRNKDKDKNMDKEKDKENGTSVFMVQGTPKPLTLFPRYRDLDKSVLCLVFSFLGLYNTQVKRQATRSNTKHTVVEHDKQEKRVVKPKDKTRI